jgi:hypothetical protein
MPLRSPFELPEVLGLAFVITATLVIVSVRAGRKRGRSPWMWFFAEVAVSMTIVTIGASFLVAWLYWRAWDNSTQSIIDRAISVKMERLPRAMLYEVDLPRGVSARLMRFDFDPAWVERLQLSGITGILAGWLALLVRWLAARRFDHRHREGFCTACGYNLTGNLSGVCPECGTPTASQKLQGVRS